jgi:hypothetical protein
MRIAIWMVSLALVAGPALDALSDEMPSTLNGMERVPGSRVKIAYQRPGTDWKKFRTVQIRALSIPLEVRDAAPPGQSKQFHESYVLGEREVEALQKAYMEIMRDKLGSAGYTVVDTPAADTLVVATNVMAIRLSAPIENTRRGYTGRSRVYSQGGGSISITAALADGATGQVVAEVADSKWPNSTFWSVNNSTTNLSSARQAFGYWANALRDRLKSVQGR